MLETLKQYANDYQVPIITDEGLDVLLDVIRKNNIKHVLEIGSAIGYSALAMASLGVSVDTFERDEDMIKEAKKNIKLYDEHHLVNLITADALTYDGALKTYDLIFIDAAKSQYMRFFEKYSQHLSEDGVIVCDNLYFHHLDIDVVTNKHTKALLKKLAKFRSFLEQHQTFETTFIAKGDGLSLSKRKK